MNSKRLHGAFTIALAGGLILSACGDDPDTPDAGTPIDLGPADTGVDMGAEDTGVDMGVDMGTEDTGVDMGTEDMGTEDMGTEDTGIIDTGVDAGPGAPLSGTEGADCDETNPMSPCDPGLDCLSLSPQDTDPADIVAKCLRQCETDADCGGSTLTPAADTCQLGVCVQGFVGEGEIATLFRETTDDRITVCTPGLERYVGYQFGLTDGEVACVRFCERDGECTTPGLETCNIQRGAFTSTAIQGVCAKGPGYVGAPCSRRDATEGCTLDFDGNGFTICVDYYGQIDALDEGICTGICGDIDGDGNPANDPTCVVPPNRAGDPPATCITAFRNGQALFPDANGNPTFGTCSDNCSAFPNSCGGTGPNGCFTLGENDNPELTRCYDVKEPALPAWSGVTANPIAAPTAAEDCTGIENQCPDDSFCIGFDGTVSGCAYGCDAQAAPGETGCEGITINGRSDLACAPLVNGGRAGFCFAP